MALQRTLQDTPQAIWSPQQVQSQRELAAALLQNDQPVTNWAEGLNALAEGFIGGRKRRRADQDETAGRTRRSEALASLLSGSGTGSSSPTGFGMSSLGTSTTNAPSQNGSAASTAGVSQQAANVRPIELASTLLGAGEVPDRSTIKEYLANGGVNLDPATTAWCAAYVNSTLAQTGFEGTGSNMARSFLNYGEAVDTPQRGDLAVFSRGDPNGPFGHVGFFEGLNENGTIRVLGGNQGDSVSIANYNPGSLLGYRRPVSQGIQVASADGSGPSAETMNALMSGVNTSRASRGEAPMPMPQTQAPSYQPAPYQPPQQQMAQMLMGQGGGSPDIGALLNDPWTAEIGEMLLGREMDRRSQQEALMLEQQQLQEQRAYDAWLRGDERAYDRFTTLDDRAYTAGREDQRYAVDDRFRENQLDVTRQGQTPSSVREYEYARSQGYQGSFEEFDQRQRQSAAQSITLNTAEGNKFYETLDADNAKTFSALSEEGMRGRSKLAQIDRLGALLETAPSGGTAVVKQALGEWGINTEGLGDIQAVQALINELVPQQRQPGSGQMSDADLALFKQSLPRLINQPGGNQIIIDTMRGITQYQIAMGEIADRVADRALTPAQAREQIRNLRNPLEGFKVPDAGQPDTTPRDGGVPVGGQQPLVSGMGVPATPDGAMRVISSQQAYDALPSGATFIAPDGQVRRKP